MRSRAIRWIAVLAIACPLAGVAAWRVARPYVRAASLMVRSAGLERKYPGVASWQRQAFVERETSIPSRSGPMRARVYAPARITGRAVLLVPGVNALGIDEPRLMGFSRQLAATGLPVITPELPDLTRYAITPRSTDQIEDAARWLTGDRGLCPDGRAGLVGISFAGGLAIVAAGRPSIADRLAFVVSFGGHGDFPRVVRYLCTGLESDATAAPGAEPGLGTTNASPSIRRPPHDYGVAVMVLDLAARLVPTEQVQALRQGVLAFLEASHRALYDAAGAERGFAGARERETALPEPAKTYLHLVNTRDVEALGARLLPVAGSLGDDPALSPERSPAPRAPVYLLHGAEDNVVPPGESTRLAAHLAGRVPVRVLLSPVITHAEVNRKASRADVWKLIEFWASVLGR